MFNFIPGVIVQDSLGGWAIVQIRGIDEVFNQKVLFLLDGVPYHQPSHSLIPMEGYHGSQFPMWKLYEDQVLFFTELKRQVVFLM